MGCSFQESPTQKSKQLAARFEKLGIDVHASQNHRYLVLLQDAPGEIVELGRPLKSSRIFATNAVRKNIKIVDEFEQFAKQDKLKNCMFWCIGMPKQKVTSENLTDALRRFNNLINLEFTELRKRFGFELLAIAIHPRFDNQSGLFDLHAHFVCRIAPGNKDVIQRRILSKFSRTDVPTIPIKNAAAVCTYLLWGIWRNEDMIKWPDHALEAAWQVAQQRFRLFRAGGAFARFRASVRKIRQEQANDINNEKIKKNREETEYKRQHLQTGDKLIAKVKVRRGGNKIAALLYEIVKPPTSNSAMYPAPDTTGMYTSAPVGVTQDSLITDKNMIRESHDKAKPCPKIATKSRLRHIYAKFLKLMSKIHKALPQSLRKALFRNGDDKPT